MALGAADTDHDASGGRATEREKASMQAFVRGQMNYILLPIGDSVRDLEAEVSRLSAALAREASRLDRMEGEQNKDGPRIDRLDGIADQLVGRMSEVEESLGILKREKSRLEADHEVTKATLQQAEASLRASDERADALRQDVEAMNGTILRLEFAIQNMGNQQSASGQHIAELKDFCEGLNSRYTDMVQDLKDMGRAGAATDRALQQFRDEFEAAQDRILAEEERLKQQAIDLEKKFYDDTASIRKTFEMMQQDVTRLKSLRLSQDAADKRIKQLEDGQVVAEDDRKKLLGELKITNEELADANKELAAQKKYFQEMTNRIEEAARKTDRFVAELSQEQREHSRAIEHQQRSVGDIQKWQSQAQNQVDDHRRDLSKLKEWRTKEAIPKMDANAQGVQASHTDISKLFADLGLTKEEMQRLKDELAQANVVIAKLGSRYDVCSGQLQGISKGLQDTSMSVSNGTDGMIKPKVRVVGTGQDAFGRTQGAFDRTLPSLSSPLAAESHLGDSPARLSARRPPSARGIPVAAGAWG